MPDTNLGYRKMKKRIMFAIATIAVSVTAIIGLSSFASKSDSHADCHGKHCTYTVGCDCSGFSPKTDGAEWEKAYCKKCGHHKSYHK